MKTRYVLMVAAVCAAFGLAAPVRAQVITSDPSLPVVYPDGVYRTPDEVHATFSGPGLTIVLTNIEHQPFAPVNRRASGTNGTDELEEFNSVMVGLVNVNGGPFLGANANGPVDTIVFGKVGNTTGTFQTEMLSMSLTGSSPFGSFMVRESPTLPSLGQTTITDVGGGMYHIDSFFDVFTELSIDGGATWMPDQNGPARVYLVPEPSTVAVLAGGLLALGGFRLYRGRRQS